MRPHLRLTQKRKPKLSELDVGSVLTIDDEEYRVQSWFSRGRIMLKRVNETKSKKLHGTEKEAS